MGLDVARRDGIAWICVEGSASVRLVSEAHHALLESITHKTAATVDLTEATAADAAFLQLITSARSTFTDASLPFEVVDPTGVLDSAFPNS